MADTVESFQFASLDDVTPARTGLRNLYDEGVRDGEARCHSEIARLNDEIVRLQQVAADAEEHAQRYLHSVHQLDTVAQALNTAIHEWRQREVIAVRQIEQDVIAFALDVAHTILGDVPLPDRVRAALAQLDLVDTAVDAARLRMHPDTVNALGALPDGWTPHPTVVVADDTIPVGDVVCEIGDRRIDAGFGTALTNLRRTLLQRDT